LPTVVSSGIGRLLSSDKEDEANYGQIIYIGAVTYAVCFFVIFVDFKHFEAAGFKKKWQTLYNDLRTDN